MKKTAACYFSRGGEIEHNNKGLLRAPLYHYHDVNRIVVNIFKNYHCGKQGVSRFGNAVFPSLWGKDILGHFTGSCDYAALCDRDITTRNFCTIGLNSDVSKSGDACNQLFCNYFLAVNVIFPVVYAFCHFIS